MFFPLGRCWRLKVTGIESRALGGGSGSRRRTLPWSASADHQRQTPARSRQGLNLVSKALKSSNCANGCSPKKNSYSLTLNLSCAYHLFYWWWWFIISCVRKKIPASVLQVGHHCRSSRTSRVTAVSIQVYFKFMSLWTTRKEYYDVA